MRLLIIKRWAILRVFRIARGSSSLETSREWRTHTEQNRETESNWEQRDRAQLGMSWAEHRPLPWTYKLTSLTFSLNTYPRQGWFNYLRKWHGSFTFFLLHTIASLYFWKVKINYLKHDLSWVHTTYQP